MKKNVGKIDRIARVVMGLGVLSLTVIGPQTPWGFLGIIPIATAAMGFCPLYPLFGMNTCAKVEKE